MCECVRGIAGVDPSPLIAMVLAANGKADMAGGWLQRATAAFGRTKEEPRPQPFAVTCACGNQARGVRVTVAQKATCQSCGEALFVLPVCVYPLPGSVRRAWFGESSEPATGPASGKGSAKPGTGPSIADSTTTSGVTSPSESKVGDRSRATPGTAPGLASEATTAAARLTSRSGRVTADGTGRGATVPAKPMAINAARGVLIDRPSGTNARLRRLATPLRMVVAAMIAMLLLTGVVVYRNIRYEQARTELQPAIERGNQALSDGDFATAAREFRRAVEALERLGRSDAAAGNVRQLSRETTAAAGLAPLNLAGWFQDQLADRDDAPLEERFLRQWRGQWMIVEARVRRISEPAGPVPQARWQVLDPIVVGKGLGRLELTETGWRLPEVSRTADPLTQPGAGPLLFAAPIMGFTPASNEQPEARILLDGSAAVLWTSWSSYEAVFGAVSDPTEAAAMRARLDQQRQWLDGTGRAATASPESSSGDSSAR